MSAYENFRPHVLGARHGMTMIRRAIDEGAKVSDPAVTREATEGLDALANSISEMDKEYYKLRRSVAAAEGLLGLLKLERLKDLPDLVDVLIDIRDQLGDYEDQNQK